jgi:fumarylacetoacetase
MIQANDPLLKSWLSVPSDSDFPLQNIPFGIMRATGKTPVPATRIGNTVVDLSVLAGFGYFNHLHIPDPGVFSAPVLNDFIALGKEVTGAVRNQIAWLFSEGCNELRANDAALESALFDAAAVQMMMPVFVGDYTDFYSSMEHATNVGIMFRDPEKALLPNWKHIPVGYHGRSSSIVVSGTDIIRPLGQTMPAGAAMPSFGPSRQVDFELEMAFITNRSTQLGRQIPVEKAEEYIFGMVLFNDLSARDIQKWEYVPLGPFLGKNFGSVISPWVVTLEALEAFRVDGPVQDPPVLPYLRLAGKRNFDIRLEVYLKPADGEENLVCRSNFRYMYWNMAQQLAHHTVNGCNINPGDLYASGTISGPDPGSYGSMLELAWKGTRPIKLRDGSERTFIQDHDTVIMRGYAKNEKYRIGFGEVKATIRPALKNSE